MNPSQKRVDRDSSVMFGAVKLRRPPGASLGGHSSEAGRAENEGTIHFEVTEGGHSRRNLAPKLQRGASFLFHSGMRAVPFVDTPRSGC